MCVCVCVCVCVCMYVCVCVCMDFPGSSAGEESTCNVGDPALIPGPGRSAGEGRRDRLPFPVFLGFSGGLDDKESACHVGHLGLIPGLERCPGRGHGNPHQYSCLENPMDRGSMCIYLNHLAVYQKCNTTW